MKMTVFINKIVGVVDGYIKCQLKGFIPVTRSQYLAGDVIVRDFTIITNHVYIPVSTTDVPDVISADWKFGINKDVARMYCKSIKKDGA